MLDGWHVFDDGAGLTSKVGTMPVCLFGAAESNKFLVDDLKVAQVTGVPRAVRLVCPVHEGLLTAIRVGVGASKLVMLSLGKGLKPPPVIILQ